MKNITLLLSCSLFVSSGCNTMHEVQVEDTITAEQKVAALSLAKEFEIENINSISIPFNMTLSRYLAVRGDEQLQGNIGRYKELTIYLEEESFDFDPPRKITPTLHDCSMSIVEFTELEIDNSKKRILTTNVNPELAHKLLEKIYNSDFAEVPNIDTKNRPSKDLMSEPDHISRSSGWNSVRYEFELMSSHVIYFNVEEGNIIIQEYGWHIH